MTPVVLVQTLGIQKIDMRYCSMRDLDADVSRPFWFDIRDGRRLQTSNVLHEGY